MSDKEYEITFSSDGETATIKEKKPYYSSSSPQLPDPTHTRRESIGLKLRNMPRGGKIFLTLLFNIYGVLHRWSSNSGLAYLFSFVQSCLNAVSAFVIISAGIYGFQEVFKDINDPNIAPLLWATVPAPLFWLLDFLCVLFSGEVRILGHKFYPDVID